MPAATDHDVDGIIRTHRGIKRGDHVASDVTQVNFAIGRVGEILHHWFCRFLLVVMPVVDHRVGETVGHRVVDARGFDTAVGVSGGADHPIGGDPVGVAAIDAQGRYANENRVSRPPGPETIAAGQSA